MKTLSLSIIGVLAFLQIYIFFQNSFSYYLVALPILAASYVYSFVFYRSASLFRTVCIIIFIPSFMFVMYKPVVSIMYYHGNGVHLLFLIAVRVFIAAVVVYLIHTLSRFVAEKNSRGFYPVIVVFAVTFFLVGYANTHDLKPYFVDPINYPNLSDYKLQAIGNEIKANDPQFFLSVRTDDTYRLDPFLDDCNFFFSYTKRDTCFKSSYFRLAQNIALDKAGYINKNINKDTSGPIISICEMLPDTEYNDGRNFCYRNNAERIEHCEQIKSTDTTEKRYCIESLAIKKNDPEMCNYLDEEDSWGRPKDECLARLGNR